MGSFQIIYQSSRTGCQDQQQVLQVWEQGVPGAHHLLEQEEVVEESDRGREPHHLEQSEPEQVAPAVEECGDFTLMTLLGLRLVQSQCWLCPCYLLPVSSCCTSGENTTE